MRRTISLLAVVALLASGILLGATGVATGGDRRHERNLTLKVGDHCSAPGCTSFHARLSEVDGSSDCTRDAPVRLQHWQRDSRDWELVDRARTGHKGSARFVLDSARGLYRAVAPETGAYMNVCLRAVSPERHA